MAVLLLRDLQYRYLHLLPIPIISQGSLLAAR